MKIVQLTPDSLSLEFHRSAFGVVQSRLRNAATQQGRLPKISRARHATFDTLLVGPHRFILTIDDGDLALISTSRAGSVLLHSIARTHRRVTGRDRRESFRDRALADVLAA